MTITFTSLYALVMVLGLILFYFGPGKVSELGRILFLVTLLWLLSPWPSPHLR